jgi:hypothetical protein
MVRQEGNMRQEWEPEDLIDANAMTGWIDATGGRR